MTKYVKLLAVSLILFFPFLGHATNLKPLPCQQFNYLHGIKEKVQGLDPKFNWTTSHCHIITARSIFPRNLKNGHTQFTPGLTVFIYELNHLKFICLPGWNCQAWKGSVG